MAASYPLHRPVAVVPVRDGVLAAGGDEAIAEVAGRAILVGSGTSDAAAAVAAPVAEVELLELGEFAPGTWAAVLAPFVAHARWVLLPASADGRDLAPRLAAELGHPLLAAAIQVTDGGATPVVTVVRRGGLVTEELAPHGSFVATLQPGVRGVDPRPERTPAPVVRVLEVPEGADAPVRDAAVLDVLPPDAATMDLGEARRIVGGGAGLMSGDGQAAFERLTAVGEAFGASMGATRVVTDAGLVPHTRQIGTTGVVVDPELYLAFGISGAVQHTAGLGHPDHVISVNLDPHCPMMAMADLAVVADAGATLEALADRLGIAAAQESVEPAGEPTDDRRGALDVA